MMTMKRTQTIVAATLIAAYLATPTLILADAKDKKAKAYPLQTCLVSGEKLGGMGKEFVFKYEGQEIKLCCKSCKKDFDKEPAKFMKKLAESAKAKATDKK